MARKAKRGKTSPKSKRPKSPSSNGDAPSTDHKRFNVDLTPVAMMEIKEAAAKTGQSMSEWARIVLRKAAHKAMSKS